MVNNQNIDEEIIRATYGDCLFLYYSNISNDKKVIRLMNGKLRKEWDEIYGKSKDHYKSVCTLINQKVHPEDREKLCDVFKKEKYTELMKDRKTFTVYFRYKENDEQEDYIYEKLTIARSDETLEDSNILVFLSIDVDEEFRNKLRDMEQKKQYYSVTYALGREYSSIYYVDMESGKVTPYNLSNRIEGMFGDKFYKFNYDDSVEEYIKAAVLERDKEMMRKVLSRKFILSQIAGQDHFTWVYQNNEGCYCEMKCVRVSEPGEPAEVVMGFAVKDAEIRVEMEEKAQRDFQLSLLDGLSRDYEMVWLLRKDRKMRLFRVCDNPEVQRVALQYYDCPESDSGFSSFIDRYVCEEDRERLKEFTRYDTLVENVPAEGMYATTFKRIIPGGNYVYIQLCFTRAVGPDGEENIVCACRDVDALIREENARRELYRNAIKERDLDGLTGIRNRYCYEHYIIDVEKNKEKPVSIIYIDADFLHEINNSKGHDAGDALIRFIADNLIKLWGIDYSFRIGGDEFVVFDYEKDRRKTIERLETLKRRIREEKYSISIGYSYSDRDFDLTDLLAKAEKAMYEEKEKHHKDAGYLR